jgi:ABC-2 type transport system ATP-binding protein
MDKVEEEEIVIKVDSVYKDFILPHERTGTVKGMFTSMFSKATKQKEIQHALKDISFEIKKGEFFGIVGRNGSGKSTLLKIIAGIYQPTKGSVESKGRLVPFIELGVGFNGELSGRDNVYLNGAILGFSKKEIDKMYDDIVSFAELGRFMDQKLKNYSSGMQVRLAFSLATRAQADILVVDEVLAVGDADFQKKCFKYFRELKKRKKTVVFVSHDMHSIQEYCDRAIFIEKSEIVVQGSTYDATMAYTRMFLEQDQTANELKTRKKRWGTKQVVYTKASINSKALTNDEPITLSTVLEAKQNTKVAICGFKIKSTDDDKPILGTNTKLKKHNPSNLKKGEKVNIEWEIPNVFNAGSYSIDLAIQSEDYADTYDWWEEAIIFSVETDEDSSYSINPVIPLKVNRT